MDATQVCELIEKTKAESLQRKRAAADELRALLLEKDRPGKGDHARLIELTDVLGIRPEQLPEVLEILQKLDRYDRLLAEKSDRLEDLSKATAQFNAVEKAIEADARAFEAECAARREPAYALKHKAESRIRELSEPQQWRCTVAAKWSAIVEGITYEEAFEKYQTRRTPHGGSADSNVTVAPKVS